ncbi:hypothetical protein GCM10020256_42230 [Streptomyces thermocoprophilus]
MPQAHHTRRLTVIGGGFAGLTAAITAAEAGAKVTVYEAHHALGGRARTADGPYRTNEGPHALYNGGPPTGPGCAGATCSARSPRCRPWRPPDCACTTRASCAAPRPSPC